jgi:hypothetical protein
MIVRHCVRRTLGQLMLRSKPYSVFLFLVPERYSEIKISLKIHSRIPLAIQRSAFQNTAAALHFEKLRRTSEFCQASPLQ